MSKCKVPKLIFPGKVAEKPDLLVWFIIARPVPWKYKKCVSANISRSFGRVLCFQKSKHSIIIFAVELYHQRQRESACLSKMANHFESLSSRCQETKGHDSAVHSGRFMTFKLFLIFVSSG